MKKIFLSLLICSFFKCGFSQSDSTLPVYLRFPVIPKFSIYKASDSTLFTREDLKKKPTLFFIFSPDCEHCKHETAALLAGINKFKNTQIIMATHLPYNDMEEFYKNYKIANYPEITMGRDAKLFFPIFFKLRNFPSVYVYDKKGNFKKSFEGSVPIDKIAESL